MATLRQGLRQQQRRSFSSTPARSIVPKTNVLSLLPRNAPNPPVYPYPKNTWFKQANHGLYGGAMVQFGNNVSEENETKTRRRWLPNIKHKHVFSQALNRSIRLKVSTRVLRTIDKVGGLDNYVLGKTPQRLKELGEEGWKLRWAILHTPLIQERAKTDTSIRAMIDSPDLALSQLGQYAGQRISEGTVEARPDPDAEFQVDLEDDPSSETEHMVEMPIRSSSTSSSSKTQHTNI